MIVTYFYVAALLTQVAEKMVY